MLTPPPQELLEELFPAFVSFVPVATLRVAFEGGDPQRVRMLTSSSSRRPTVPEFDPARLSIGYRRYSWSRAIDKSSPSYR
jgi:hypothetical protein